MLPCVFLLSATSPTLDLQVRSPRLHRQTNAFCFRLLRSEASVVHPFRPSFHGPSFPYSQRTDSHVFVAPCSSSPSPGRCGLIRSSLPSSGQCGLHVFVALLVAASRRRHHISRTHRHFRRTDLCLFVLFVCFVCLFVCLFVCCLLFVVPTYDTSD